MTNREAIDYHLREEKILKERIDKLKAINESLLRVLAMTTFYAEELERIFPGTISEQDQFIINQTKKLKNNV